jgi:Helix-turn-helix domain
MTPMPRILSVGEEPPPLDRGSGNEVASPKKRDRRSSRGRFESINAFLDVTFATLGRAELAVWLLLWRDTKPDGLARTSQDDLARRAGCNPRTVRRALVALGEKGLLTIVRQGGLPRRVSVYRVHPIASTEGTGVRR